MKKTFEVEMLKLKHSKIIWVVILAPLFMVVQGVSNFIRYYELFTSKGQNIWDKVFEQSMIFYCFVLLPILITLVMVLVARIENKNDGWKYFLTLPVKRKEVYMAKLIIGCGLTLINILVFSFGMLIAGKLVGAQGAVPYGLIFGRPFLAYIASFPLISIMYLLSIRFSHSVIPLGIGIGCTVPAILAANTKLWIIYPWTYPSIAALSSSFKKFSTGVSFYPLCIVMFFIFIIIGVSSFMRRDIV